jgi:uncharacterized membrane protein
MTPDGTMLVPMNKTLARYLAASVVSVALDILWLGRLAKATYPQSIGYEMAEQPKVLAASVSYVPYAAGLMIFAMAPIAEDPASGKTVSMGALFGFFAYATCDLSTLATLRNWPVGLAFVDMARRTLLSAAAAAAGKVASSWTAKA